MSGLMVGPAWWMRTEHIKAQGVTFTIHGVHSLKSNDLWGGGFRLAQEFLQVFGIIMAEDILWNPTVTDALDHGGMIPSI